MNTHDWHREDATPNTGTPQLDAALAFLRAVAVTMGGIFACMAAQFFSGNTSGFVAMGRSGLLVLGVLSAGYGMLQLARLLIRWMSKRP